MIDIKQQIMANALPLTLILQAFISVVLLALFAFVHFAIKKLRKEKGHFVTRL